MSREITRTGRFWLMLMIIMGTLGIISNTLSLNKGIIYIIMDLLCIIEVIGLVFLLRGKGLLYFLLYSISYTINAILNKVAINDMTTKILIYTIIGVIINIGFTFLAVKNTIKKTK